MSGDHNQYQKATGCEMNEQIQLLAKQADATVLGTMTGKKQYTFLEHDLEKFAQLIIQECIDKIETYQIPVGNSAAGEMASLKAIRDNIKQHFGVE